ncbi:hypothetical protein SAMN05421805_106128 [Saccharopolyspora antimicrobica]|uniref:DUF4232 domain-containing protein n=1 Tax=Saccharopolyspora antimicrobica TaxID=455193 RepID=A0A1I5B5X5_9PSEU|nr:hypothetical protein [Saccharopolyspora antimicrobica]RKT86477.1 hypothetical protein ATL45_4854 [Saccharopolyspora antimicrobica]SFN70105.1 hypothetical protein SAMN05421805_106128 [Saccharopolyspora antimicrobica]
MNTKFRIAAIAGVACVVGVGAVTAGSVLASGPAVSASSAVTVLADPGEVPCTAEDIDITVTKDLSPPGEYEEFLIKYSAATPETSCTLQGPPIKAGLFTEAGPVPGVVVESDDGMGDPVLVEGSMFGISRISQTTSDPANPVIPASIELTLPGVPAGQDSREVGAWPAGEPVKGSSLYATQITQSAAG